MGGSHLFGLVEGQLPDGLLGGEPLLGDFLSQGGDHLILRHNQPQQLLPPGGTGCQNHLFFHLFPLFYSRLIAPL